MMMLDLVRQAPLKFVVFQPLSDENNGSISNRFSMAITYSFFFFFYEMASFGGLVDELALYAFKLLNYGLVLSGFVLLMVGIIEGLQLGTVTLMEGVPLFLGFVIVSLSLGASLVELESTSFLHMYSIIVLGIFAATSLTTLLFLAVPYRIAIWSGVEETKIASAKLNINISAIFLGLISFMLVSCYCLAKRRIELIYLGMLEQVPSRSVQTKYGSNDIYEKSAMYGYSTSSELETVTKPAAEYHENNSLHDNRTESDDEEKEIRSKYANLYQKYAIS